MSFTIHIKHLLLLIIAFILFTVIGTVSHEYGHIIVAKSLGYETALHYASMNFDRQQANNEIQEIYKHYKEEIENNIEFEKKAIYESKLQTLNYHSLLVRIGGPLQTILTGIIGLLILYFRRNKIKKNGFLFLDWIAVFLSLFWLRQVFNLTMSIANEIISSNGKWFGGDEYFISKGLNLWVGTVSTLLGIVGFLICCYITFKVVPKTLRFTFILSGFIGGVLGFILWMNFIGPFVLP